MTVRVRFAPSPTGELHIGGARTALFNYLFAKKNKGVFILRIEDTDISRNKPDAEVKLIEALKWLGLFWDEGPDVGGEYGPYRSMERLGIYQKHLKKLVDEGTAYPCYCTKQELEYEKERMLQAGEVPRYSGKCRGISEEERKRYEEEGRPYIIRFKVPEDKSYLFNDHIRGQVRFESKDIEDFVILKSDGIPTYHFAVTIDDALMKITHVIRGEEHLSNTPKHLMLFEALGFGVPDFAHIPLILNNTGKKLSKRDESLLQFIEQYRDLGFLPEAVNNYLALLGWSPPADYAEEEIFSMEQLEELFSLDRVSKAGAIFDLAKMTWVNGQYIKKADVDLIVEMAKPYFKDTSLSEQKIYEFVSLFQSGMNTVSELTQLTEMFLKEGVVYNPEAKEVLAGESVSTVLSVFKDKLVSIEEYNADNIKKILKEVQKETGYKGKQLFMPIRAATTGQVHGPDLDKTLYLLGKETVINRITNVL